MALFHISTLLCILLSGLFFLKNLIHFSSWGQLLFFSTFEGQLWWSREVADKLYKIYCTCILYLITLFISFAPFDTCEVADKLYKIYCTCILYLITLFISFAPFDTGQLCFYVGTKDLNWEKYFWWQIWSELFHRIAIDPLLCKLILVECYMGYAALVKRCSLDDLYVVRFTEQRYKVMCVLFCVYMGTDEYNKIRI